jgi:hypothetical protein
MPMIKAVVGERSFCIFLTLSRFCAVVNPQKSVEFVEYLNSKGICYDQDKVEKHISLNKENNKSDRNDLLHVEIDEKKHDLLGIAQTMESENLASTCLNIQWLLMDEIDLN